jgi:16S rRNA processing protein RimM
LNVELVAVAKIKSAHGVRGKVRAISLTDFPSRFTPGLVVKISPKPPGLEELTVEVAELRNQEIILKFIGIDNRQQAESLKGLTLEVPASETVPLEKGTYWHFQIIGLEVFTTEKAYLGKIEDILTTGANDVYVVKSEESGREILIPAIKEVVKKVDLENEVLIVSLIPGLIDEE